MPRAAQGYNPRGEQRLDGRWRLFPSTTSPTPRLEGRPARLLARVSPDATAQVPHGPSRGFPSPPWREFLVDGGGSVADNSTCPDMMSVAPPARTSGHPVAQAFSLKPRRARLGYRNDVIASGQRSILHVTMVLPKVVGGLLVAAATFVSAGSLAAREPTCVVAYDDDRLTVHADRVPLADVVREIGRQSGAEIVGEVRKPRDVTRQFDRVPLVDALARLLGEQNFTLRYGSEGKLRKISLLGEPLAAAAQTTAADASNPDKPASGRRHRHHHDVRSSRETLPDGQVLVSVAGADTGGATNPRDASNGLPEDPARHGGSSQQGATMEEQWPAPDELDRKLRRGFLDLLGQMDEGALAAYFETPEGQKARTVLEDFAANHPSGHSNQKANDILNRAPGGANAAPPGRR